MLKNEEKFRLWFSQVIESLYKNKDAGFPILMITFPLLERYLRSKSKTPEVSGLGVPFYSELVRLFPELLNNNECAKNFWQVYRNGILHQATLSQQNRRGTRMPGGWLSGETKAVEIKKKAFWVNPVEFAKLVISVIENDFSTFEALSISAPGLAKVQITSSGNFGTSASGVKVI